MLRRKSCIDGKLYETAEKIQRVTSFSPSQLYWWTDPRSGFKRIVYRNRVWHYMFEHDPNPFQENHIRALRKGER